MALPQRAQAFGPLLSALRAARPTSIPARLHPAMRQYVPAAGLAFSGRNMHMARQRHLAGLLRLPHPVSLDALTDFTYFSS